MGVSGAPPAAAAGPGPEEAEAATPPLCPALPLPVVASWAFVEEPAAVTTADAAAAWMDPGVAAERHKSGERVRSCSRHAFSSS